MEVNHKQLKTLLKIAYKTKQPLFVKGTMGIGKSAIVQDVAKEIASEMEMDFVANGWEDGKFGLIDMRLSQYEPTDLRGCPIPDLKNETTAWLKPKTIPRGNSSGIIFFDELNLANHSVQAAAYQIIRDRQIDDMKLPDGWLVISAGNGSEDKANIFDMPAPLANRFTHCELKKPSADEWCEWAAQNNISNDIITYIQFKPSNLHNFNPDKDNDAFPTPRSWEMLSNVYTTDVKFSNTDEKFIASSCIGDGVAHEFLAFKKLKNELNIPEIVKEWKSFKTPEKVDLQYALAGGLAEYYSKKPEHLKDIVKIWTTFKPEFTIISMKLSKSYRPIKFGSDILKLNEWKILSKEYGKYI